MSETLEYPAVVVIEADADAIIVDVVLPPAQAVSVDVLAPPPAIVAVEIIETEADTIIVDVVPSAKVVAVDVQAPTNIVAVEIVDFGGPPIGYPQLPAELRQLPISFPFGGKPGQGIMINVPMGFALTLPAGLAGVQTYAGTQPTTGMTFTVNRLSAGVLTQLGTITLTSLSQTSNVPAGTGGPLAAGDVLQVLSGPQDETAADIGITIMANRV